jgi:5,10-methylenetetrahydromethanopterin reductase
MSVSFGIRIPPCDRLDRVADAVARAEALGFDTVWVPDSQLLWRDAFQTLTAAALRTERIRLACGVTNIVSRHPSVVASACRTVQELAPGRVVLGLGAGFSAVAPVGLPRAGRNELATGLQSLRALLRGDTWDFGAGPVRIEHAQGACPVYLAASGPRTLELAGASADGAILLSGPAAGPLGASLERVRAGAAAAGRPFEDLDVVVTTFCHVTDEPERDARLLKPIVLGMAQLRNHAFLAAAGLEIDDPGDIPGVYPDMLHAEDWETAMAAADPYVTDEMALQFGERVCLYGTATAIAERIGAARDLGVTSVYLQGIGSYQLPYDLMDAIAARVMPLVNGAAVAS